MSIYIQEMKKETLDTIYKIYHDTPQTQCQITETNLSLLSKIVSKKTGKMTFGEDISNLINTGDRKKLKGPTLKMPANKMTVIFDMFCSFVKNIIVNKLNSTMIVTM